MVNNIIQLEYLSKGRWYEFSLNQNFIGKVSGNYAIFLNKKLQYVGESIYLSRRIISHKRAIQTYLPKNLIIKIKIRIEKNSERFQIERNLITRLKPPGNKLQPQKKIQRKNNLLAVRIEPWLLFKFKKIVKWTKKRPSLILMEALQIYASMQNIPKEIMDKWLNEYHKGGD